MRQAQLKAFHSVALHGGFSKAASALALTQPAISEQVRRLEQAHDVLLFFRDRKKVTLTPAGEALYHLTERFFEIEGQITEFMSQVRADLDGKLRIIVDSAFHITSILSDFRQRYPHVTVILKTGNTDDVLSAVRAYEAEIGIAGSRSIGRDMDVYDLGTSPIIAFAAKGFFAHAPANLSLPKIADLPLVFREKGSKTRARLEQAAAKQGVKLRPVIEAEGREANREIVASGAGIGFISGAEFGHDPRLLQIPITGAVMEMHESLVHLRQRKDVRVIQAFTSFVQNRGLG